MDDGMDWALLTKPPEVESWGPNMNSGDASSANLRPANLSRPFSSAPVQRKPSPSREWATPGMGSSGPNDLQAKLKAMQGAMMKERDEGAANMARAQQQKADAAALAMANAEAAAAARQQKQQHNSWE